MSDTLAGLLMQEQARSVRLEAERNRWAELAGEKEGEITTLRERLAEAHQLLQDALIYGCDGWWAKRLAAHLGTADSADDVPAMNCPKCRAEYEDHDGFGVLHCPACGYCKHPSRDDGVCGLCGDAESADDDPAPWCHGCGVMKQKDCHCGPIAENE
jgi:rubrerythrin